MRWGSHYTECDLLESVLSCTTFCLQAGWVSEEYRSGKLTQLRSIVLYALQAPVLCKVFKRTCIASVCEVLWDEGESMCVHVLSNDTCAGDEIGWMFIDRILSGHQSFTGFCQEMTNNYRRRCPTSRQFMSAHVFIKWWFSWAANHKIDFREPCSVCKYHPKILACDGTKLGVVHNKHNLSPIEKPDNLQDMFPTQHRRNDRCFLSYTSDHSPEVVRTAREHLCFLGKYFSGDMSHNVPADVLFNKYQYVLLVLPHESQDSFTRMCLENISPNEQLALGQVFQLLSTTAPVSAFLPFQNVDDIVRMLDHITGRIVMPGGDVFYNEIMKNMRSYAPELRELLAASGAANQAQPGVPHCSVVDLVLFIANKVIHVHEHYVLRETAIPIRGSYNPPKFGRAYYFSPSGEKLRNVRKFTIDDDNSHTNFDDQPDIHESCEKEFPGVTRHGTTYLFLWFCPIHGHCYGFHVIPKAEGRKDPATSLYSHLETPPETIFYDFACSLHEYTMNRESHYYNDVRFFHDLFHSYTHKCSSCYKSARLDGFEHVNSEICEQFNHFIKCIKYPSKQMSLTHFVFFLQFFIHLWNQQKSARHKKKLYVAARGAE